MTLLLHLLSRRQFLRRNMLASVMAIAPGRIPRARWHGCLAQGPLGHRVDTECDDPAARLVLALRALDAATAAGATYADVRLTRTINQAVQAENDTSGRRIIDREELAVGVRALVRGAWGFAASPVWTPDEMSQLAREAVSQAAVNANAMDTQRHVELVSRTPAVGMWTMPGIDPLEITLEEKLDLCRAWRTAVDDAPPTVFDRVPFANIISYRQERTVASTDGGRCHQIVYQVYGGFAMRIEHGTRRIYLQAAGSDLAGCGWEHISATRAIEQIPALLEEADQILRTPVSPVDIGRYTTVFDARTTASLLDCTLGLATQLDRALGYEANGSGTSYLGPDPLTLLGTPVAAPLLSVTADRSLPGGLATARWDDEGSVTTEFPLVHGGILMDYQTTREQAAWLEPWYRRQGVPVPVHGCTATETALTVPRQHVPNLAITPGTTDLTFDDLVAQVGDGIAVLKGSAGTDWQGRTGVGYVDQMRVIQHGKLGKHVSGNFSFTGPTLWNHLVALGGARSVASVGHPNNKGQPQQETWHTVSAVPAVITDVVFRRTG